MLHVKLFENFNNDEAFVDVLHYKNLDIYNKPSEWKDIENLKCKIKFKENIKYRRLGIENIQFVLESVELEFDLLNEEEEAETVTISHSDIDFQNVKVEVGMLPFFAENLEIDMKSSTDPKNWKYQLQIGRFER
jgi:hypothetical protein